MLRPVNPGLFAALLLAAIPPMIASPAHADDATSNEAAIRDGKLFDPGVTRTEPAESAPEQLKHLAHLVGDWTVQMELFQPGPEGVTVTNSEGRARVTFMNRGHALMERTRVETPDMTGDGTGEGQGHRMSTIAFWNVDAQGVWTVGEGNSWTESIRLLSGGPEGALEFDLPTEDGSVGAKTRLVVHDALRPGGGPLLLLFRRTYESEGTDHFTMTQDLSQDLGETWSPSLVRRYARHRPEGGDSLFDPDFFPIRADIGQPALGRAEEAAQFDFLLGEFDAKHWQSTPQGEREWQSVGTAVHVLDGHAILEFDSFDLDPSLPDAATSILRVYNRAMRRWESLFLPNRTHRPLYFGGVREGDEIVLHLFGANTGPGSVFRWIFYDMEKDSYLWKGLRSSDRGESFQPTWTIEFSRRGVGQPTS